MNTKHIFGPIRSRRLGVSLGINLLPEKICSLDCVYCEAGKTELLTTERKAYTRTYEIFKELTDVLKTKPKLDYITFSGIGEPTLHSDIGEFVKFLKINHHEYKVCLITNSTMFVNENIHHDLAFCDLIMPSLDAVSDEIFHKIDRPHKDIKAIDVVEGLITFRKKYKNQMWLEIFFLEGINDAQSELALLKQACEKIKPDKIQINSLDRAGTEDWVKKVSESRLLEIKEYFKPLVAEIV